MNKKLSIYLTIIGLLSLLFSCKKDETKVVILATPIVPTFQIVPDLTLKRANGKDTLVFVGTPVNPGFQASATYFLEACANGTNFKDPTLLISGNQDLKLKITVGDLNGLLLKKFPADQVSLIDLRIRSVLSVDAGTGAPGTSSKPMEYSSATTAVSITIYGLPRLDLINSGITQKIESALGDGKYTGFVKLDATKPFTLKDPDANIVYGVSGVKLGVNGTAIPVPANGWYQLSADTKGLTYSNSAYMIGLIGDATPNGWNSPDSKMDFDNPTGSWVITLTLVNGSVKFRKNDDWNSGINLGIGTGYSLDNLFNGGSSSNIPITAGNYTIRLYISSTPFRCTFTKNN
jgi:starch-binding outer membrane protein SusE/F